MEAAQAVAQIISHYYRNGFKVDTKADNTPVTQADIESEQAISHILQSKFPDYGFYGEETGKADNDSEFLWLVDPIDGTKSFVRGYPLFSTQIALMHKNEVVLGVSSAPEFNEIATAVRNGGARLNGQEIAVSDVSHLEDATVSTGNLKSLASSDSWPGFGRLVAAANRIRGYGDFYHYHLLATGKIDVVLESDVNILDIAALSVIVEEAGGKFTDVKNKPITLETTTVLASNGHLHKIVNDAFL
ncbi:MAG: inositol-phosphate phosphatase [Gammaproteobacteria bacterium]|nr:inositol-phosphate phosphatase [Gammaproteobacteria bacterium]